MYKFTKKDLNLMILDALSDPTPPPKPERKPVDKVEMKKDLLFFISIMSLGIVFVSTIFYGWIWIWQKSVEDVILNFFK